ncbi:Double-stranded RNA-binding protein Staufen 1 [Mactra antiquata]
MKPNMNTGAGQAKQNTNKPSYTNQVVVPGQTSSIGTFIPAGSVTLGMSSKTVSAGVAANPHHFPSSLSNQNGVSSHVTSTSQSQDTLSTVLSNDKGQSSSQSSQSLANTKEKTPMCLINELARFNRVTHQYTLVDEQGPAHKKTFFVKLKIGDKEEYSSSGASIKKAQHAAAAIALDKTEFKHPPPKTRRVEEVTTENVECSSITPTVELNSLAMKRGEPAIYRNIENRNPQPMYYQQNYDFRGMYNQRYHFMHPHRRFYVSLKVGTREFIGEGLSRQMARHNAAKKALEILRSLTIPDETQQVSMKVEPNINNNNSDMMEDGCHDNDCKSEISLVHEIALRHNLPVSFDVIRESGPPHMKNFVTQCRVGNLKTEADGNSKKISKKRAAEFMLLELRNLPTLPANVPKPKAKPVVNKKKNRNLIKQMQKADPTYGVGINPISRLIQIQQAQKKKEPIYSLLAERGLPRRREFVMQVQVEEHTCTGVGPNKKLAKRHAAEAMLQLLGYNKPSPQPPKPAIKMQGDSSLGEKKVTFSDTTDEQGHTVMNGARQMVPGLIVLPEGKRNNYSQLKGIQSQYSAGGGIMKTSSYQKNRAEMKLREVCARNNIEIKFDEFAGAGNPSEYLSRLIIASSPPHTLHGSGNTPENARDDVATNALKILTDIGLIKDDCQINMAAGDGPQIKS